MSLYTNTPGSKLNLSYFLSLPLDQEQSIFSRGAQFRFTSHISCCLYTALADTALPTLIWRDFIVRASASQCPWPLLGPHLFLFPCISSIFVSGRLWAPVVHPALAWAGGSMSGRASYCNQWPAPQPPFGPWPLFPQLWTRSFISAEPGPWGHNDFSSLGSQPLSQLKLLKSWLILLQILLTFSHLWHNSAGLAEMHTLRTCCTAHKRKDVAIILIPRSIWSRLLRSHCACDRHTMHSCLTRHFV